MDSLLETVWTEFNDNTIHNLKEVARQAVLLSLIKIKRNCNMKKIRQKRLKTNRTIPAFLAPRLN